jgi:hypothetical protein
MFRSDSGQTSNVKIIKIVLPDETIYEEKILRLYNKIVTDTKKIIVKINETITIWVIFIIVTQVWHP